MNRGRPRTGHLIKSKHTGFYSARITTTRQLGGKQIRSQQRLDTDDPTVAEEKLQALLAGTPAPIDSSAPTLQPAWSWDCLVLGDDLTLMPDVAGIYAIQLEPRHDPWRVKIGRAQSVPHRLRGYYVGNPFANPLGFVRSSEPQLAESLILSRFKVYFEDNRPDGARGVECFWLPPHLHFILLPIMAAIISARGIQ